MFLTCSINDYRENCCSRQNPYPYPFTCTPLLQPHMKIVHAQLHMVHDHVKTMLNTLWEVLQLYKVWVVCYVWQLVSVRTFGVADGQVVRGQWQLREMKYIVMIWRSWVRTQVWSKAQYFCLSHTWTNAIKTAQRHRWTEKLTCTHTYIYPPPNHPSPAQK